MEYAEMRNIATDKTENFWFSCNIIHMEGHLLIVSNLIADVE